MLKGVLFDFDGTLTRPGALDFSAIKQVLGCPSGQPILEYLQSQPTVQRKRLMRILGEWEERAAKESLPNRGAERCLHQLKENGFLLGIITRNSMGSVKLALRNFVGLSCEDFVGIITREDALPKPHPDGVNQAAKKMGILPSELAVVGDFRFDVMAAKAAGACAVLLTNGGKSVMEAGDPAPDHIISYLEELAEIL